MYRVVKRTNIPNINTAIQILRDMCDQSTTEDEEDSAKKHQQVLRSEQYKVPAKAAIIQQIQVPEKLNIPRTATVSFVDFF